MSGKLESHSASPAKEVGQPFAEGLTETPAESVECACGNASSTRRSFLKRAAAGACACLLAASMGLLVSCGGSSGGASAAKTSSQSGGAAQAAELQIFAANSLEQAMPLVQALYTERHPEVTFADSFLVGNTPYPQMWAVRMGLLLLGLDLAALIVFLFLRHRRAPHG